MATCCFHVSAIPGIAGGSSFDSDKEFPNTPASVIFFQSYLTLDFLLAQHTTLRISHQHLLTAMRYIPQRLLCIKHYEWRVHRVEKNMPLLLMSSQSSEEQIGDLEGMKKQMTTSVAAITYSCGAVCP